MKKLIGTGTALVTPFKTDKSIDVMAFSKLVDWQIENKIEFLVPCGSTGEGATMSRDEKLKVIKIVLEQTNGRVPVVAGTGTNSTIDSVKLTNDAYKIGVRYVLVVGPYYNKPTQQGFYEHFKAIAESCPVKIVIYNVPGRTGSNILPETILKLASDFKNIIGVKEASNVMEQVMQIIKHKPNGFSVLSGEDSLTLPIITSGGDGVISVISNEVPMEFGNMVRYALKGNLKKAQNIHYKLFDLMKANFLESNPIPVKTALAIMKKIDENFRLPLTNMSAPKKTKLKEILRKLRLV
jgi:4-hydroxy-tetrahydrodipicolinate synthase